jgi:hypothetical protein
MTLRGSSTASQSRTQPAFFPTHGDVSQELPLNYTLYYAIIKFHVFQTRLRVIANTNIYTRFPKTNRGGDLVGGGLVEPQDPKHGEY